jgi:hypothetical protein
MKISLSWFGTDRRRARWSADLREAEGALRGLSEKTESEFLGIGAQLQDFHHRAGEITGMSSAIAGIVSAEGGPDGVGALQGLLDRMEAYLSHSAEEAVRVAAILSETGELLRGFDEPLAGFRKLTRILRILGISTKIESARLGGEVASGFETVADHVERLARMVEEKTLAIEAQKVSLANLIESRLASVLDLQRNQKGRGQQILAETRGSIAFLASTRGKCSEASGSIASRSEEVGRNIAEVVMSMQSHDITRQQLEHVSEAIADLARSPEGTADVCRLQSAHLAHAREELLSAVARIQENLRGIARNVADMSKDAKGLSGMLDRTGQSFLVDMQKKLGHVTASLGEAADSARELGVVMETVSGTSANMMRFVADVETFGSEIELIALNAAIKATRSETRVEALRVLAESIQMLSKDAHRHAGAVSKGLKAISGQTNLLRTAPSSEHGGAAGADASDLDEIGRALSWIMGHMQSANETLETSLRQLDGETASLSEDIERAVLGITAHEMVAAVIGAASETLDRIAAEAGKGHSAGIDSGSALHLRELAERYTMAQEREVHQAMSAGRSPAASAWAPPPAAFVPSGPNDGLPDPDSLGDNVELF